MFHFGHHYWLRSYVFDVLYSNMFHLGHHYWLRSSVFSVLFMPHSQSLRYQMFFFFCFILDTTSCCLLSQMFFFCFFLHMIVSDWVEGGGVVVSGCVWVDPSTTMESYENQDFLYIYSWYAASSPLWKSIWWSQLPLLPKLLYRTLSSTLNSYNHLWSSLVWAAVALLLCFSMDVEQMLDDMLCWWTDVWIR